MSHCKQLLIVSIVWLVIDSISASCVSNNTYCLTGSSDNETNGEYSWYPMTHQNHSHCQVFRHATTKSYTMLHSDSLLNSSIDVWLISYNFNIIDGFLDSIAYCNESLLDDCTEGKWYLLSDHRNTSISIEPCIRPYPTWAYNPNWWTRPTSQYNPNYYTPSPTYYRSHSYPTTSTSQDNNSAVTVVTVVCFVVLILIVSIARWASRNGSSTNQPIANNSDSIHKNEIEGAKFVIEADEYAYPVPIEDNKKADVLPSAPEEIVIEGELEGLVSGYDRYNHIKQWFDSQVNLPEYNKKYCEIFIVNGYDEMSLIKEISGSDLIKMGITKLAHNNRILNAIQNIQSADD